jgi:hypothetical protein
MDQHFGMTRNQFARGCLVSKNISLHSKRQHFHNPLRIICLQVENNLTHYIHSTSNSECALSCIFALFTFSTPFQTIRRMFLDSENQRCFVQALETSSVSPGTRKQKSTAYKENFHAHFGSAPGFPPAALCLFLLKRRRVT